MIFMIFFLYCFLTIIFIPFFLLIISLIQRLITFKNTHYFDFLCYLSTKFPGVKNQFFGEKNNFIHHGILLSNHRSWFDFPFDNYLTKSCVISRKEIQYVMLFAGLLRTIENNIIYFSRGKTSREELFHKIKKYLEQNLNTCILLYPEGTRLKHTELKSLEETRKTIKPGLLKSIYEDKTFPVQIYLSSNKEKVLNEKSWSISFGVTVKTIVCNPIHPKDFKSFEGFYDKIIEDWYNAWNVLYRMTTKVDLAPVTS